MSIQLLRDDEVGRRTGVREHLAYPQASKLLQKIMAGERKDVPVHMNSLPDLLQAKVEACPLFARLLSDAWERNDGQLTLVVFSDDTTPGNGIGPTAAEEVLHDSLQLRGTRRIVSSILAGCR